MAPKEIKTKVTTAAGVDIIIVSTPTNATLTIMPTEAPPLVLTLTALELRELGTDISTHGDIK